MGTKITSSLKKCFFGQSSNMHELYVWQKKWKVSCKNPHLYGFLIRYAGIWHVSSMTLKHEESILKREIIFKGRGKLAGKLLGCFHEKCRMKSTRNWLVVEVETQVGGKIESQPPPPMLSPVRFVNTLVLTNRTVLEFIAIPMGGLISRFPKHSSAYHLLFLQSVRQGSMTNLSLQPVQSVH